MRILKPFFLILLTFTVSFCEGQKETKENKYLSLGSKTSGFCLGNSNRYNGIRLNLWDRDYKKINGFNFSFRIEGHLCNGLQIGGLASRINHFNGLSITTLAFSGKKANGIGICGFTINCDTLRGLFVSPFVGAEDPAYPNKIINGVGIGIWVVGAEKIKGVSIAVFICYSKELHGLSIAASNTTEELHGLQVGLINYAGNNPRLLKWLPLLNFHP